MGSERFHQMDFCRAVFMYCGLVFHCGLIYGTGHSWRVESDETIKLFFYLSNFLHHFRMEAFYLVGGFFYLLIYQKGRPNFLSEKLVRAAVPMVFIGITLNILMNHLSVNQSYPLNADYVLNGKWLSHLWFLGNLIVYFVLAVPICRNLHLLGGGDNRVYFLSILMVLLAFAVSGQLIANYLEWKTWIFINLNYLAYFFSYFLMGVFAFYYRFEFMHLINIKRLPFFFICYVLLQVATKVPMGFNETLIEALKLLSHFPLMLAAFSLLCYLGDHESKWIRKFSDASYTIYLLHQPLLIFLYIGLFQWLHLGAAIEYTALILLVFVLSYTAHFYIVDRSPIMRLAVNGVIDPVTLAKLNGGMSHLFSARFARLIEYFRVVKRDT